MVLISNTLTSLLYLTNVTLASSMEIDMIVINMINISDLNGYMYVSYFCHLKTSMFVIQ